MRHHPLFSSMPPGYSGPPPEDDTPKQRDEDAGDELGMDDTLPLDMTPTDAPAEHDDRPKIRSFEQKLASGRHEDKWDRSPNVTGTGAIHVKSFHARLTGDSLEFLDQQINEWLDRHPQYEVKLVTTAVGTWSGKLKEPNIVVNVWV